jgi:Na+/H+-dicarboxylate symporter
MLQIIFFAVIFGVALTLMDEGKADIVVTLFDRVQEAMVLIIHMVMSIAPFGVAALVADVIGSSGASLLLALGVYAGTVLLGLFLHAVLVYGGLVVTVAKLKLGDFLRAIRPAQLIAFSTSSSSATLPVSMECVEENLGVSNSVSSFVLPLGSTVNMDGTALYQGVAAIFIAQVFGISLGVGDQITIVLTATMASVGAAGVPGAGMVTLAMVLTATGIPQVGIALILGMDRLLDMFRTAVNVTGDLAVTSAMAASEGETLQPLSSEADAQSPEQGFEGRLERDEHPVEPKDY